MSQPLIDLQHISKRFDDTLVLDDLSLSVKENSFVTLLGPSGCGKTTTLRIIGGFESPNTGKVIFGGEDITKLPPNKRQLNTVFQKYALFPHMSIADNIAFGLKIKNKSKAYIDDKIKYALKLVNLNGFEHRSIDSLSGGQQQRIAIARAIVNEPKVLLLDEPLGALDLKLRQDMQYELIRLKNELGITFIYVTHDQEEALTMSDTIVVMNQGYIQQMGSPEHMVASKQTQTTNIHLVTKADAGNGITRPSVYDDIDGLATDIPEIALVTFYADCVPLYFVDPVHRAIGLAHSGWRGTVAGMGACMVRYMQEHFNSRPEELVAAIGPSICVDCYEVSEEVAEQFKNLNAGAIDISCDSSDSGGFSFEMPGGGGSVTVTNMGGGPGGGSGGGTSGGPGGGMEMSIYKNWQI